MKRIVKTMAIDPDVMDLIEKQMEKEHRTFTNFIIHAVLTYLNSLQ